MNFHTQMSILIQLSLIDNQLSSLEKRYIYALGKANKMPEKEIDALFEDLLSDKDHNLPNLDTLSDEDKFDYLYNVVQLMKIDKKVYLSEIRFCQNTAAKLGYKKAVVAELSANIYSDPAMTTDREKLKKTVLKYKLSS